MQAPDALHVIAPQSTHATPMTPQSPVAVPGAQAEPFAQPVQQAPVRQSPPVHGIPSAMGAWLHAPPPVQLSVVHALASSQSMHAPPAVPQRPVAVPG